MKNKKEIIITENVEKSFGNFQALKGITATVKESEVVVVLVLLVQVNLLI